MKAAQRRTVFTFLFVFAGALAAGAYYLSLVPASHPDHDHGMLNIDAGGRLIVTRRDGSSRNLVGRPEKVLFVHFLTLDAPGAAEELASLFAFQERLAADKEVDILIVAKTPDFAALDAWLKQSGLTPPSPGSFVVDTGGETTLKMNSKRPLETMAFAKDGKLSWQARGRAEWGSDAAGALEKARGGVSIE